MRGQWSKDLTKWARPSRVVVDTGVHSPPVVAFLFVEHRASFSIPTARRLSSNFAHTCSRAVNDAIIWLCTTYMYLLVMRWKSHGANSSNSNELRHGAVYHSRNTETETGLDSLFFVHSLHFEPRALGDIVELTCCDRGTRH